MANKVEVVFFGDSKQLQKTLGDLNKSFGNTEQHVTSLATRAAGVGDTLTRRVSLPLAAAGVAAVKVASDQEQAFGALDSQLGEHAGTVRDFGETAAKSYGLSREQVARMGAVTVAQLKGMGFETSAAAEQTIALQQRGADLAATFGGPVEDAVAAIGALLRGERDPIERYGVSLKQADINAGLLAQGLGGLEGEERKLAEAQVALTLFMDQTADSAGQFGREIETTAGQAAVFKASASDLAADLGDKLLPIATKVLGAANDLVDGFTSLPEGLQSAAVGAALFGAALGPVLSIGGRLAEALTPLGKGFKQLYDTWALGRSLAGKQTASFGAAAAALGGVTLAVGAAVAVWQIYERRQAESQARVDELTGSLDENTGAITDNTRAVVVRQLEEQGALETARALGLSLEQVTDAAMGNTTAQREVADATKAAKDALEADIDLMRGAGIESYGELGRKVSSFTKIVGGSTEELDRAKQAADREREALYGTSDALTEAGGRAAYMETRLGGLSAAQTIGETAAEGHTAALDEETDAAEDGATAHRTLEERIRAATDAKRASIDPTFAAMEAEDRLRDATAKLAEVQKDQKATTDDVNEALRDVIEAQGDLDAANADAMGTTKDAAGTIRDLGRAAGLSESDIKKLTDDVDRLGAKLRDLRGTYTAKIEAVDVSGGQRVSLGQIGFEHDGGVITSASAGAGFGLKPNERLTALEVGEEVLTKGDPRHRRNIGRIPTAAAVGESTAAAMGDTRRIEQLLTDLLAEQRAAHARSNATPVMQDLSWAVVR